MFLRIYNISTAQEAIIDSPEKFVATATEDIPEVDALNYLTEEYRRSDLQKFLATAPVNACDALSYFTLSSTDFYPLHLINRLINSSS